VSAVRECRLRREYAGLYPGIEPDIWEVAANVAERLHTRRGWSAPTEPASGRLLEDGHFDFRGGRRPSRQGSLTRLGDTPLTS
jgi:hypothetical protein